MDVTEPNGNYILPPTSSQLLSPFGLVAALHAHPCSGLQPVTLLSLAHMKGEAFDLDHTAKTPYLPKQMQDFSSAITVRANHGVSTEGLLANSCPLLCCPAEAVTCSTPGPHEPKKSRVLYFDSQEM